MSFVIAQPEMIAAAAGELASIRSAINAANAAAAAQTTGVMSAAADEVSTAVAALFSSHAQAAALSVLVGLTAATVAIARRRREPTE